MSQGSSLRQRRTEFYLLAGIILGITVMATPAAIYWIYGYSQPPDSNLPGEFFFGEGDVPPLFRDPFLLASPLDAFIEVIWLIVPGVIVVVVLYLLLVRRGHWAGYDESAKGVQP